MSSLNLHLDFMDKNEPPVRFVELTAEEELQIIQDSVRLMEQIDEDFRILDRMCSALENMILIQNHYDEYGSSPALEALVGDIKEYLGISMEAEEAASDTSSSDSGESKGGLLGAIEKIWDWIMGLFRRIGEWLKITDKIVDSNTIKENVNLDASSNHDINLPELVFSNGQVVDKSGELKALKDHCIKTVQTIIGKAMDVTISVTDGGTSVSTPFTQWTDALEKAKAMCEAKTQTVKGSQIKELNANALKVYKAVKPYITEMEKKVVDLGGTIKGPKKPSESDEDYRKRTRKRKQKLGPEVSKSVDMLKQTISVMSKGLHGITAASKVTYKIAYPKAVAAKEAAAKKKEEEAKQKKEQSANAKPADNKQPEKPQETKPEEKK